MQTVEHLSVSLISETAQYSQPAVRTTRAVTQHHWQVLLEARGRLLS